MISAFCPGHISCVFQPMSSFDGLSTGSRGIGIRLDRGCTASVEERDDGVVNIFLDGSQSVAHITRMAVESLAPGQGMDVRIENDLPVSQGFGMSAAGAIAAAVCVADLHGIPRTDAFKAAHCAEVMGGGGLGDVAAIVAGLDIPIRTLPGMPPLGKVANARFRIDHLTLGVIGGQMRTDSVLGSPSAVAKIRDAATAAMDLFLKDPSYESLFAASNMFSSESGLETPAIRRAIVGLNDRGYGAGMCMLGNSIFTDAPEDVVRSVLGRGHVRTYRCASSRKEIVTRRA